MNPVQQQKWANQVLQEILKALLQDRHLQKALIFKGAWILNHYLKENRHSKDIDSTMQPAWVKEIDSLDKQEDFLKQHLQKALFHYFESQNPVRYTIQNILYKRNPKKPHPRHWDMIQVFITIQDHNHPHVRGLPNIPLEISAPEEYGPDAIVDFAPFQNTPESSAKIYSLHRIAGEKLRAFLTSLPQHQEKTQESNTRAPRVKDLYDLHRIHNHLPLSHKPNEDFWIKVSGEFLLACKSRFVSCASPDTFKQNWTHTQTQYMADANLKEITFENAERSLDAILNFFLRYNIFPIDNPLPVLIE